MTVLPRITAPAARRRATHAASAPGRRPAWIALPRSVGRSAVSTMSLTPTGTPCSGPRGSLRVALARLGERGAGVEVRPRPDGLLALGDPLEARRDEHRRGEIPGGDPPRRLGRAEAAEVRGARAHPLNTASGSSALTMYCPASTISEILRSTHRLASR